MTSLPSAAIALDMGGATIKAGRVPRGAGSQSLDDGGAAVVLANHAATATASATATANGALLLGAALHEQERQRAKLRYMRPIERGYCVNWNLEAEIWTHLLDEELRADPREHALATAPLFAPAAVDAAMDELVFEHFGFPAFCRVAAAEMSALAHTHSSSSASSCQLVVDAGFSFTHVAPVINGRVARRAVKRVNVGGKLLTNYLKHVVSFRQYDVRDAPLVVDELKEALCFCSLSFADDLARLRADRVRWLLPDFVRCFRGRALAPGEQAPAQVLDVGLERVAVPELLFHPSDIGLDQAGVAEAVMQALALCPRETHSTLLANVLLVGGSTRLPNFAQRLAQDLRPLAPSDVAIQLHAAPDPILATWQGCRLFAARPENEPQFVTKAEYDEHGAAAWHRRRR
ncbi:hypothetical protein ATCC90586_009664 [Pythium insidiosum]|nr:hypothetical protein ATCC90586_009664 [Pythium insidiosum]